ncbi:MAG: hypothetical protein AB1705_22600 [Verrucomicrobiota bacterium]
MRLFALLVFAYWIFTSVTLRWQHDLWVGAALHWLFFAVVALLLYLPPPKPVAEKLKVPNDKGVVSPEGEAFFDEQRRMIIFPRVTEDTERSPGCFTAIACAIVALVSIRMTVAEDMEVWGHKLPLSLVGFTLPIWVWGIAWALLIQSSFRNWLASTITCAAVFCILAAAIFAYNTRDRGVVDALAVMIVGYAVARVAVTRYRRPPPPPDPVIVLDELDGEEKEKWEKEAARLLEKQQVVRGPQQNPSPGD